MKTKPMKMRGVRLDDNVWNRYVKEADKKGTSAADIMRDQLTKRYFKKK